jgi:hypothetical protein
MKNNNIKEIQLESLKAICIENNINFDSIKKMLEAEKIKKLQTKNHNVSSTITYEIEKNTI